MGWVASFHPCMCARRVSHRLRRVARSYLWGNAISGTIPSQLASLSNMAALSLKHNAISGTLPTALASLSTLRSL